MKKQLSIAKNRYSFKEAFDRVPFGKIDDLKKDLYEAFNINNRTSWSNKLKGIVSPSIDTVQGVETIFLRYGIKDCWIITELEQ